MSEKQSSQDKLETTERLLEVGKKLGVIAAAGVVVYAAFWAKNKIENMGVGVDGKHKVEIAIGAPTTTVHENVSVSLAEFDSTFSYDQKTSLDMPLFIPNCDTHIDQDISTKSKAGMKLQKVSVVKSEKGIDAVVEGPMTIESSGVNYDKESISVDIGSLDVCVGTKELDYARGFVDNIAPKVGEVGVACALKDRSGRDLIDNAVKSFLVGIGDVVESEKNNVNVYLPTYTDSVQTMYTNTTQGVTDTFESKASAYLNATDKHDEPKLNIEDLKNCSNHTIIIGEPITDNYMFTQ